MSSNAAVYFKKVWCCVVCKNLSWYSEVGCVVDWVGFCCTGLIQLYLSGIYPHSQVQSLYFDCVFVRTGAGVDLRRADVNGVVLKHSVAQTGISHREKRPQKAVNLPALLWRATIDWFMEKKQLLGLGSLCAWKLSFTDRIFLLLFLRTILLYLNHEARRVKKCWLAWITHHDNTVAQNLKCKPV